MSFRASRCSRRSAHRAGYLAARGAQSSDSLKLEARIAPETVQQLRALGHEVELLAEYSEVVGHAGAIVRHNNGMLEGAFDPRSNGSAAGF